MRFAFSAIVPPPHTSSEWTSGYKLVPALASNLAAQVQSQARTGPFGKLSSLRLISPPSIKRQASSHSCLSRFSGHLSLAKRHPGAWKPPSRVCLPFPSTHSKKTILVLLHCARKNLENHGLVAGDCLPQPFNLRPPSFDVLFPERNLWSLPDTNIHTASARLPAGLSHASHSLC